MPNYSGNKGNWPIICARAQPGMDVQSAGNSTSVTSAQWPVPLAVGQLSACP